jgi:hypothetical protein
MSGPLLKKRINLVNAKIARRLGFPAKLYRSSDYIHPVQPSNIVATPSLSWSVAKDFTTPGGLSFNQFNIYVDSAIKVGDVVQCESENRTFVIVDIGPLSVPQGFAVTTYFSIYRPAYTPGTEFKATRSLIYQDVPATRIGSTSTEIRMASATQHVMTSNPQSNWDVYCWLPEDSIKAHDIFIDDHGDEALVKSISYSEVGYKITVQSTKI